MVASMDSALIACQLAAMIPNACGCAAFVAVAIVATLETTLHRIVACFDAVLSDLESSLEIATIYFILIEAAVGTLALRTLAPPRDLILIAALLTVGTRTRRRAVVPIRAGITLATRTYFGFTLRVLLAVLAALLLSVGDVDRCEEDADGGTAVQDAEETGMHAVLHG
jgi:hypothetical protein